MDLRWYQSEAVAETWRYLCEQSGNPVVVLPTGAGKSVVIGELAKKCVGMGGRVMILAHRKELLEQNADKVRRMLPGVAVGMYSAGLNSRSTAEPVVCAGIQSAWNKAGEFGERHLLIVDEAHLVNVNDAGMYRRFLSSIVEINTRCRMVGLTATPYRTDDGDLCGGDSIFSSVCYEAEIPRLIGDGFLSRITSRAADASVNTSGLHVRAGEFVQREMEDLFSVPETVLAACREIISSATGRKSVLVFCSGVGHGEMVRECLETLSGERVGIVIGSTPGLERMTHLEKFKSGELRWLVNVDVLTTGFDAPNIDCIAVLRATCSPGLFAQICGRGFRLSEGKKDCLILDFGENIERHGPLDAKDYGKKRKSKGSGEAPEKFCESCKVKIPAGCRLCPECGTEQPMSDEEKHGASSSDAEILESLKPAEWYDVEGVNFREWHNRKKNTTTLRVDYQARPRSGGEFATMEVISEWVCLEHDGYAYEKAMKWIGKRTRAKITSIQSAIVAWGSGWFAETISIKAKRENGFKRPVDYVLGEIPDPINEIVMDDDDPERATWGEIENELSDEVPF
jgi:DNA repair protein RadD